MQKRRNSSALAMELYLFCIKLSVLAMELPLFCIKLSVLAMELLTSLLH